MSDQKGDRGDDMSGAFQRILDSCSDHVSLSFGRAERPIPGGFPEYERVVAVFSFSQKGFGFGEFAIVQDGDQAFVDTEHMSLDRVKGFISRLLDGAILDTDDDPTRHRLYNERMGRRCGGGCKVCHDDV